MRHQNADDNARGAAEGHCPDRQAFHGGVKAEHVGKARDSAKGKQRQNESAGQVENVAGHRHTQERRDETERRDRHADADSEKQTRVAIVEIAAEADVARAENQRAQ